MVDKSKVDNSFRARLSKAFKGEVSSSAKSYSNLQRRFQPTNMNRIETPMKRFARYAYPQIPSQAVASPQQLREMRKRGSGSGGRGRPKGSYKYIVGGRPVSVFTYRRVMSTQRAYQRLKNAQQIAQGIQPQQQYQEMPLTGRVVRRVYRMPYPAPQLVTPQYSQEASQEMQQQIPQGYSQDYPQEMQQYPQQVLQQYPSTIQREIKPVFKSFGGHPFPPINNRPLISNPGGEQYEDVDLMTGRRYLKTRPQPEKWIM